MLATLLLAISFSGAAESVDDALRVEQLVHAPARAAAAAKPAARGAAKPDADAGLVGQSVRVRTVDGGLYGGTLQSIDATSVVLRIALPKQALDYTLPRGGVSGIEAADSAP